MLSRLVNKSKLCWPDWNKLGNVVVIVRSQLDTARQTYRTAQECMQPRPVMNDLYLGPDLGAIASVRRLLCYAEKERRAR